jgi:hypothetical protein
MSVRSAVLLLPALCGVLRAQSPLGTTAGDVPARDDSIYALRVDPANYRGHDEVFLLEDGIVGGSRRAVFVLGRWCSC